MATMGTERDGLGPHHDGHDDSMDTMNNQVGVGEGRRYFKREPALSAEHEQIVTRTIACGISVHRELGPGFKERIDERVFLLELDSRGMKFESEKPIEVRYKEWLIPGQKIDLIVEGVVLVELKAVPKLRRIHLAQVFSYLKTTDLRVGLLMNFNARLFKEGLRRIIR